jgi:hypothetical protein
MIHAPVEAARSIRSAAAKISNFSEIKGLIPMGKSPFYSRTDLLFII